MAVTKCSLDMQHCDALDEISTDLCNIFKKDTPIDLTFMRKSIPPLKCPFEGVRVVIIFLENFVYNLFWFQGIFDVSRGHVNLEFTNKLPLEGRHWLPTVKIYERINNKNSLAFCMNVKITFLLLSSHKRNYTQIKHN